MRGQATRPSHHGRRRQRAQRRRRLQRWTGAAVVGTLASALAVGLAFAGSPERLAPGVHIAGVDVGGMTATEAEQLLERRSRALERKPVTFVAETRRWRVAPARLGVEVDWGAAVAVARREGDGFGPVRGLRRLQTRFFGADIAPPTRVYDAALRYELGRFARAVDRPHREASLELRGLRPVVLPERSGRVLDRAAAAGVVVRALASFSRAPVGLPVRIAVPRVTAADLAPAAAQARVALSAPVRLQLGPTRWRLPRWRIAEILDLPRGGEAQLRVGGAGADRYFARLARTVEREPEDADWVAEGEVVRVVPARDGVSVDVDRTAAALFAALRTRAARVATVTVERAAAERTTAEANAMGIDRVLASYSTDYAGTADRIRNLQLAVAAVDGTLVAPGATFSFNETVGERTEERGYRSAPVIIGGEYEEGVGGGVSQVATTVFNAAWEAGLPISERNPHALYISRYEVGRDATVNYPELDLRFVNDTEAWILVRGGYGATAITVSLYGGEKRVVETSTGEIRVTGAAPVRHESDPTLEVGETVVEEEGTEATAVTVRRVVYSADGTVLRDEWWPTSYRGEYRIIRFGTKPKPEPEPEPQPVEPEEEEEKKKKPEEPATTQPPPIKPPPGQ